MNRSPLPAVLLFLALPAGAGTAIGNPSGRIALRLATPTAVTVTSATARTASVTYTSCMGSAVTAATVRNVDLLAGAALPARGGRYCGISYAFGSPVEITGTSESGATVVLSLDVPSVSVSSSTGFIVSGTPLVLELGAPDWTSASDLGAEGTDPVEISEGSLHDELVLALQESSALYTDTDEDSNLSDDERANGPLATADDDD